jgi:protein-export membrane protein SecD
LTSISDFIIIEAIYLSMARKRNIRSTLRWGIVGIFALLFGSASFVMPAAVNSGIDSMNAATGLGIPRIPAREFTLGLDLQGGAHLIYQADVSRIAEADRSSAVEGVRDVIERRVNAIGVGEPSVQTARVGNDYRINVELPGVTDVNNAIVLIGETPILEFQEENDDVATEVTEEEQALLDEQHAQALKKAGEARTAISEGLDFVSAVKQFSEDIQTINNDGYIGFIGPNTVGAGPLFDWAQSHGEGDISDLVIESDLGYHVLLRGGEREGDAQVKASHILICYLGAKSCTDPVYTKDEARARAQELFEQANATNFADLAREHSTEDTASVTGGNLGTFGRGAMVPPFETAVFNAQVGQIVGPVESEFGFHVIYKEGEEKPTEYELSHVVTRKVRAAEVLPSQNPWKPTGLSGKQLERAEVTTNPNTGNVQVALQFDAEGAELFEEITSRHIGDPIAIFLDGEPISIPVVQQAIAGGQAVINGNFSIAEARELAQRLNTGALPVPIDLISQQAVGASLGAESLERSLKAGIAGIVVVMLFMLIYYRLPGLLAVIALSVYISVTLMIFKAINVTLSLAGIAGFILSIGMAVDANVLIFERLKEELREGKSLKGAVEEGFVRAWTSIRDGNVSTLITCALLMWFGSSFVQGFAVTLAIGILISMFSAITITRAMLRFIVPWFSRFGSRLFLGFTHRDDASS